MGRTLERLYLYCHKKYYARRLKRQLHFADKYVISVGNLSAGGTGKTPTAALLLEYLKKQQHKPLAVLRGYKAQLSAKGALVYDGKEILHHARAVGDEALLLARIPKIRVAIHKDRSQAIQRFGQACTAVVLDDAFQNPQVHRDHELVLIDSNTASSPMRLFPCGKMREPLEALSRADTVLLTRYDQAPPQARELLAKQLAAYTPPQALFTAKHKVLGLQKVGRTALIPCSRLPHTHEPIGAFCGIAKPQTFFDSLTKLGYAIKHKAAFPDHHFFSITDIERLSRFGIRLWICTAKDMVRLKYNTVGNTNRSKLNEYLMKKTDLELFALEIGIDILEGRQKEFLERVCS